jgi:predicted lysophospholipase L1 biosynthesis ABC-type transport system permease subunit
MTNPAAQPRRLFLAVLVLVTLAAMLGLLLTSRLVAAVVVGLVGMALLVLAARPTGARES